MSIRSGNVAVAIPVKNEAENIANCLLALSAQFNSPRPEVVLVLNNCQDATGRLVRELAPMLCMPLHVLDIILPTEQANAGHARRLAMETAAQRVGPGGVVLTTDADGRVAPNWIDANLSALQSGADVVAGRAEIDPGDAARIPSELHQDDARECRYADLLDEIDALADPNIFDPWPRHNEHSGASIAVTVNAYHRAGGIPAKALGEDRAFFESLRRVDARIRHASEVRVTVSGRIIGRAHGGMADTIRRRIIKPDETLDDRLEPAYAAFRRVLVRSYLRTAWHRRDQRLSMCRVLAPILGLSFEFVASLFSLQYFGEAWARIQDHSAALVKHRVLVNDLVTQTKIAHKLVGFLRPASNKIRHHHPNDDMQNAG
jgi:glycosyltransferase involved in cell wall biosynthesis